MTPENDTVDTAAAEVSGWKRTAHWLFVGGNRTVVVVGLSVLATLLFLGLGLAGVIGVTTRSLVASAFSSGITGVFTIVAVTISINQLVLSRVMGSPDTLQDRTDSVHEFRAHVEGMDPDPAVGPTMPADFLKGLLEVLRERAREADRVYGSGHAQERQTAVRELREVIEEVTDGADEQLSRENVSLFHTLTPVLTNEFSRHINTARKIRDGSEELTEAERRALDELIEALETVNLARHYFKTLYIHEELATVSKLILLVGVPAVLISMGIILLYSADTVFLSEGLLLAVVSGGFGIVLLPLNVLFAYGLRIGSIAQMTTTFGTFTPVEEMP